MIVVTSIYIAETKGRTSVEQTRDEKQLLSNDLGAFEENRELISLYEGKNRVEPMD